MLGFVFCQIQPVIALIMNRVLLVLLLLIFPTVQSQADDSASESLRAGVMYLIKHKSEIETNRGYFGLFSKVADNQVDISFSETLGGEEKYSDSMSNGVVESRRIKQNLFAYNRKEVELKNIKEEYPDFFSKNEEPQCQNAFFPYTVCLTDKPY